MFVIRTELHTTSFKMQNMTSNVYNYTVSNASLFANSSENVTSGGSWFGTEYGGWGNIYPLFMLDCKIGWQESIILGLNAFILISNSTLVSYFSFRLKKHSGKLLTKYKVLITACNVVYLLQNVMNIVMSFVQYTGWYWCFDSPKQGELVFTLWMIAYMIWERLIYLMVIMIYFTFVQRFQDSVKNSIFELTTLKRFFQFTYILFVLLWLWGLFWILVRLLPRIALDGEEIIDQELMIQFQETRRFVWDLYVVVSIIVLMAFIYKFKKVLDLTLPTMISKTNMGDRVNNNKVMTTRSSTIKKQKQARYESYLQIVSRTITLATIALVSTMITIYVMNYWYYIIGPNLYAFEYLYVLLGIDSTINIICVNLQYPHGIQLYQLLKCSNLQRRTQTCIVCCYRSRHTCLTRINIKSYCAACLVSKISDHSKQPVGAVTPDICSAQDLAT